MKTFLAPLLLLILSLTGCTTTPQQPQATWQLAFHHKAGGEAIAGSKQALIEAVRAGNEVRVYLKGRRVEHLVDANFMTLFGGEVFAQIDKIRGQAPSLEPAKIAFRENDYEVIYATNGKFELKWFISN